MKKYIITSFFVLSASVSGFAGSVKADVQKESYAFGATTGTYILNQTIRQKELGLQIDMDEVLKGFSDALKGKSVLNDDQIISYLNLRVETLNKLTQEKLIKLEKDNLAQGNQYLAANKAKQGVMETKSGLQYEVLKQGNGKPVKAESIVMINYQAKLLDGTVFDDTYKKKSPAHLSMINIIDGLKEGMLLMKEGAKYRLTMPPKLAYKAAGFNNIPPNAVVIFEVELLKVLSPSEFQKMAHGKAGVKADAMHGKKAVKK